MIIRIITVVFLSVGAYLSALPILDVLSICLDNQWTIQEIQFLFLWQLAHGLAMLGSSTWYLFFKKLAIGKAAVWSIGNWLLSTLFWGIIVLVISGTQLWIWQLGLYAALVFLILVCSSILLTSLQGKQLN